MRSAKPLAIFGTVLLLGACSGASNSPVDSAFPLRNWGQSRAGLDQESFTMRRVLGQPDNLEPLREDTTFSVREADGRTLRQLLDVEGTRPNIYDQQERDAVPPARRGSSTPPRAEARPEVDPSTTVAPRLASPPPPSSPPLRTGQTLPGTGGQVVTGGSGSTATTIGPNGQAGSAVRDGGTVTLFGADGSIRTVPAPR